MGGERIALFLIGMDKNYEWENIVVNVVQVF